MSAFDFYQQHRIRMTDQRVTMAESNSAERASRNRDEINDAQDRIDRLLLVTEAMWQLLTEHAAFTDEHLAAKLEELDLLDGIADGRRQPAASDCACGAKVNASADICAFCGAAAPEGSIFDRI